MTPNGKRRILVSIPVLMLGVSCGYQRIGGYLWEFDANRPVCERVTWHQVPRSSIPGLCSARGRAASPDTSCAIGCVVVSQYSERDAHQIRLWDDTLYAHEARHVLERLVHPHD
jgi:hypothetical protein